MHFIENLAEKEYQAFWESTPNNHFMQSYEWGLIQEKNRGYKAHYVGLKDNDKIVAAALLLKKKTPFNMCYFYCPRGFTMDFSNKKVLTEFTNCLKEYLKKENAIYLKLDPPLIYHEIDIDGNKVENGKNNYEIFNNFVHLGYKHCGFNKLYERNQPRYTFRTYFNKYNSLDEIVSNMSTSFTKGLKRSYNYDMEIYQSDNVKTFYDLIKIVSNKDNFCAYSYDYYKNIFDIFKKKGYIKVFEAKINPAHIIKKFEEKLKDEKLENKRIKLEKDIAYFKELSSNDIVIASLICTYSKTGAWSLYIGNNKISEYTNGVNRLYYEFIKDAYENKYEYFDLFGVVGDPKTNYKNLAGIYEYKRKFGGEYIEFIGEFDLINKPLWYTILPIFLKIYRGIRKLFKK
ncbi:MAG: lipid II:glycine glycyltransferase FemX [Bacilli bacterium]